MLRTQRIADMHVHASVPDIDNNLAMLKEIVEYGIKDIGIVSALERGVDENIKALYLKEVFTEARIAVFGGLYYYPYVNQYTVPFAEQAKALLDMGCDGIKLLEGKPNYRKRIGFGLNCSAYDEMFDMLEKDDIPIVWHACDPDELWKAENLLKWGITGEDFIKRGWSYEDSSFLRFDEILDEVFKRLEKNPNLNVTFAHFLFLSKRRELAEELLAKYPKMKFDITPGWPMFIDFVDGFDEWRDFFERHSDRILYGTDVHTYPIYRATHETARYAVAGDTDEIPVPMASFANMRGFDLSQKAQENIFYNNFDAIVGKPKAVNKELLIKEASRLILVLEKNDAAPECVGRLQRICKEI